MEPDNDNGDKHGSQSLTMTLFLETELVCGKGQVQGSKGKRCSRGPCLSGSRAPGYLAGSSLALSAFCALTHFLTPDEDDDNDDADDWGESTPQFMQILIEIASEFTFRFARAAF